MERELGCRASRARGVATILVPLLLPVSCSSSTDNALCIPGESRPCLAPSGCEGVQVCAEDGKRLEACACVSAPSDGGAEVDSANSQPDAETIDGAPGDIGAPRDAAPSSDTGPNDGDVSDSGLTPDRCVVDLTASFADTSSQALLGCGYASLAASLDFFPTDVPGVVSATLTFSQWPEGSPFDCRISIGLSHLCGAGYYAVAPPTAFSELNTEDCPGFAQTQRGIFKSGSGWVHFEALSVDTPPGDHSGEAVQVVATGELSIGFGGAVDLRGRFDVTRGVVSGDVDATACSQIVPDIDGDGVNGPQVGAADCDDRDPLNWPGNAEQCDGQDNDCNGLADAQPNEGDGDGDGVRACNDCDDRIPAVYPGAYERCDHIDNDCDGLVDSADPDGHSCQFVKVVAGEGYKACGLRVDRSVVCWGLENLPTEFPGAYRDVSVFATACMIDDAGTLSCADNRYGPLPTGRFEAVTLGLADLCVRREGVPTFDCTTTALNGLFTQMEFWQTWSSSGVGLRQDGSIQRWSSNSSGTILAPPSVGAVFRKATLHWLFLADGTLMGADAIAGTAPSGIFIDAASAPGHICVINDTNHASCFGQVGSPTNVPPIPMLSISANDSAACGLAVDGYPVCWPDPHGPP